VTAQITQELGGLRLHVQVEFGKRDQEALGSFFDAGVAGPMLGSNRYW